MTPRSSCSVSLRQLNFLLTFTSRHAWTYVNKTHRNYSSLLAGLHDTDDIVKVMGVKGQGRAVTAIEIL